MKQLFTLTISLLLVISLFSQTRTTVANGNWAMPTTWDCMCVPTPGSTVVINHTVTLTSNWGQSSGSITINAGGSLIQDATPRAFGQAGGSFSNAGTVTLSKMGFNGGTVSNSGTLNANDSLYMAININNTGTIHSSNLFNTASLTNNGTINGTNFFNNGTLQNNNSISFENHFNNSISYNDGALNFTKYTNAGTFYNNLNHYLSVSNDCTNGDSINHDAHWYNNGATIIGNDFTNIDILEGNAPGHFCVTNLSTNSGSVLGDFDFCDQITTGGFNLNTGTISNGITYCQVWCFGNVDESNKFSKIEIFPNPVKESFTINSNNSIIESVEIIDVLGKVLYSQKVNSSEEIVILRNNIPSGLYILKANSADKSFTSKVLFE